IGLIAGPLLFVLTLLFVHPEGLSSEGLAVLASTIWIAIWWMTEAIPILATSLLPIILFPITKGLDIDATTSAYGNDTIFIFICGFIVALSEERYKLHIRIALNIISAVDTNIDRFILGFMVTTGSVSMWISNTATVIMKVPMRLAIIYHAFHALEDELTIDTS